MIEREGPRLLADQYLYSKYRYVVYACVCDCKLGTCMQVVCVSVKSVGWGVRGGGRQEQVA